MGEIDAWDMQLVSESLVGLLDQADQRRENSAEYFVAKLRTDEVFWNRVMRKLISTGNMVLNGYAEVQLDPYQLPQEVQDVCHEVTPLFGFYFDEVIKSDAENWANKIRQSFEQICKLIKLVLGNKPKKVKAPINLVLELFMRVFRLPWYHRGETIGQGADQLEFKKASPYLVYFMLKLLRFMLSQFDNAALAPKEVFSGLTRLLTITARHQPGVIEEHKPLTQTGSTVLEVRKSIFNTISAWAAADGGHTSLDQQELRQLIDQLGDDLLPDRPPVMLQSTSRRSARKGVNIVFQDFGPKVAQEAELKRKQEAHIEVHEACLNTIANFLMHRPNSLDEFSYMKLMAPLSKAIVNINRSFDDLDYLYKSSLTRADLYHAFYLLLMEGESYPQLRPIDLLLIQIQELIAKERFATTLMYLESIISYIEALSRDNITNEGAAGQPAINQQYPEHEAPAEAPNDQIAEQPATVVHNAQNATVPRETHRANSDQKLSAIENTEDDEIEILPPPHKKPCNTSIEKPSNQTEETVQLDIAEQPSMPDDNEPINEDTEELLKDLVDSDSE